MAEPKLKRLGIEVGVVLVSLLIFPAGHAPAAPPPGVIPDHYIVVLHDTVPRAQDAADDLGRQHGFGASHVYEHAIKGFAARIPAPALAAIARDPRVQFISEDREVVAFQETVPTGVNRINAENKSNIG